MTIAVVAGATGLTGKVLVDKLIADRQVQKIIVLARSAVRYNSDKIEVESVESYADVAALALHIPAGAWVFCTLGTTMAKAKSQEAFRLVDAEMPILLARAAHQAGASGYSVVSAAGANRHGFFFYNRVKGEMERGVQRSRVKSIQIFRPALIVGKRSPSRWGETFGKLLFQAINPILVGGLAKYRSIAVEELAAAMLRRAHQGKPGTQILQGTGLLG